MMDPNTIPPSVEVIGGYNFYRRADITSVQLPSGVKELGSSCFYGCTNLKEVTFNYALETIGSNCFTMCNSLTSLDFSYQLKEIKSDAFVSCANLTSVDFISVEKLGLGCFQDCPKLVNLNLPSNLKHIGGSAFLWCKSLKTLIIPSNVEIIEDRAFEHLESIEALIFTPLKEPTYQDWAGNSIDFSACVDDNAASKLWVPSRKTYEHGQEMISFQDKNLIYSGVSPEFEWTNNTPWPVSINTSNLPYSAGEHTVTVKATFSGALNAQFDIPLIYSIAKAPSSLNILNFSELSELKLEDEMFIEWESDAPHSKLIQEYDSDAPVDFSEITTFENGVEVTKYRIIAVNEGEGFLKLRATGSPNHQDAICDIPIKVKGNDKSGLEALSAGGIKVSTEPFIATVNGGSEDTIIRLFDVKGKMIYSGNGPNIQVAQSGIYILVVNNKIFKLKL